MPLKLHPPGKRGFTTYFARGTVAGRRVEESLGTRDRKAAVRRLAERQIELEDAAGKAAQTTFAAAAVAYLSDGGEGRYLPPILTWFGPDTLVDDISVQDVAAAAHALKPGVSNQTRHRCVITPIRAVLEHFRRGGPRQKHNDNARTRWLTPQEADALIAAAAPQVRRIILTLLGTGCRTSELVKLQVSDIRAASAQVWIADPKNERPRWAAIERARALPALLEDLPTDGAAFRTQHGQAYKIRPNNSGGQFAVAFNRAREAAGLGENVTPHALRHTWATWFYAAHKDLAALMANGGWVSVTMAMRYTKLAPADLPAQLEAHGWRFETGAQPGRRLHAV